MKKTIFLAALLGGTVMAGAALAAPGNGQGNDNGNGHNAPLPIAALGFPIAAGLLGYAIRRRKAD